MTCQKSLQSILGKAPEWISYPNGYTNSAIEQMAVECGLKAGIRVYGNPMKLPIAHGHPDIMHVHRFPVDTKKGMANECTNARRRLLFSAR
jgi:peptidoglycan/xylan/chitin deacetylase (PgdA/CDA1 family)